MMNTIRASIGCLLAVTASIHAQTPIEITADAVRPHIFKLADDKLEGRGAGYEGEKKAADYIAAEFRRAGLKPAGTNKYFQTFSFLPYHPTKPWEVRVSRNVLGIIEGSDPGLKNEIVVLGAHYDGQGRAGQADPTRFAPSENPSNDSIWNSANDNAASVAALIEIARSLRSAKPKRSILFAAFGAEEHGMSGSIHYVNHPNRDLASHVAMINLEKLGRSPDSPFTIAGVMSSKSWTEAISTAASVSPAKVTANPMAFPDSDHYPFASRGVPSVMFYVSSATDEAHLPFDSAEKVDLSRVALAATFVRAMAEHLANDPSRPDFVRSPMLDPGIIAHLATGDELDAANLPAGKGGLKVTGIIAGLPAGRAGFRVGDLITTMAGRGFARDEPLKKLMEGYQDLLQGKLGLEVPIKVLRNEQTLDLTLDLRR